MAFIERFSQLCAQLTPLKQVRLRIWAKANNGTLYFVELSLIVLRDIHNILQADV